MFACYVAFEAAARAGYECTVRAFVCIRGGVVCREMTGQVAFEGEACWALGAFYRVRRCTAVFLVCPN